MSHNVIVGNGLGGLIGDFSGHSHVIVSYSNNTFNGVLNLVGGGLVNAGQNVCGTSLGP